MSVGDFIFIFVIAFAGGVLGGFLGVWLGWITIFAEARRRGRMWHER